jgi:hypothetical protein
LRLNQWIDDQVVSAGGRRAAQPEPLAPAQPEPEPEESLPLRGVALLGGLEAVGAGLDRPGRILRHDQPFSARLTLDLRQVVAPLGNALPYTAAVYARALGGERRLLGETHAEVMPGDDIAITIAGLALPAGTYRLDASVALTPVADSPAATALTAFAEGSLIQVY